MDRRFKERLIGAVALAAAAVLILPAVLNGPHAPLPEPAEPGETALRTETIELAPAPRFDAPAANPAVASRSTAADVPAAVPAGDSAPTAAAARETPPHDATATEGAGAAKEGRATAPATRAAVAAEPAAPLVRDASPTTSSSREGKPAAPAPSPPPTSAKAAAPPAARPAAPSSDGWAVQVGTFASSANATALAASLEARGYAAFVAPLAADDKTLYRVRVGPTPDVESARALEQRLERDGQKADVVRQP